MATIWEETKTQGAKMKGRPLTEKIAYFWEYYKIHTITAAVVLTIIISLIHAWVTAKDYALSIVMINSVADQMEGITEGWKQDLTGELGFDPKKFEVSVDTSIILGSLSATANQEYASLQKFAALMSSESIDILVADTENFERYAQNGYMHDLRDLYSAEELEKNKDILYYTDASTFSDYSDDVDPNSIPDQSVYTVNHHDPSSMKDPVPVGFIAEKGSRIDASGVYSYLTEDTKFQGYPVETVIGIPINSPRAEAAIIGVGYLTGH